MWSSIDQLRRKLRNLPEMYVSKALTWDFWVSGCIPSPWVSQWRKEHAAWPPIMEVEFEDRRMSRCSLASQSYAKVEVVFSVSRQCFSCIYTRIEDLMRRL